ncbi:MAG: sigma-70 family RNA polymerase sigma factor [Polyangiaceae bacterium]|nr:sigma-70 family RNA polymerase sigma factor [Polyangiaceae bacterium]
MQALPLRVTLSPGDEAPDEVAQDDDHSAHLAGDVEDELAEDGAAPVASGAAVCDGARVRKLVLDHNAFVWRSVVRLGVPRADAEDALQQVFMVAARRINDIQHGAERSFLYGVCLRVASRSRRTHARRREIVGDDAAPERIDTSDRPDELLDRARARALLEDILGTMPIELRSVFTLFELEQMTMSEIAELMAIPAGTVASRLRRARELFAEQRKRIEARMKSNQTMKLGRAQAAAPYDDRPACDDREAT